MFEAVYIADSQNRFLYEYLITSRSPPFKSLQDIINLKVTGNSVPLIEINSDYFVCCNTSNNVIIYLLCSNASFNDQNGFSNPLLPFVFITRLIEVMEDYFGAPLMALKIEANNDTLTLLINGMIDDGLPHITDGNKLRDLVPFKSFLSEILSSTNQITKVAKKSLTSSVVPTTNASRINSSVESCPWRSANVRHTNNEMYVDVIETVNVILKPISKTSKQWSNTYNNLSSKNFDSAFYSSSLKNNSTSKLVPIVGNITGKINMLTHLTGMPTLQLLINTAGLKLQAVQLHPCVDLQNWIQSKGNLTFIPPDGSCTLMDYQIEFNSSSDSRFDDNLLGLLNVDYQFGLGPNKNEFEVKLLIKDYKAVSKLENLVVEINIDKYITSIKASRLTHGDFQFKGDGKGEWNLRNIGTGIQPLLHGSIITSSLEETSTSPSINEDLIEVNQTSTLNILKPNYLKVSYSNKGAVPSGLKVDSLKIINSKGLGDNVKPFKGVKYITKTGDFVIRS